MIAFYKISRSFFETSGMGRESGIDAIREYLETKAVWINTSDAAPGNPFVMR